MCSAIKTHGLDDHNSNRLSISRFLNWKNCKKNGIGSTSTNTLFLVIIINNSSLLWEEMEYTNYTSLSDLINHIINTVNISSKAQITTLSKICIHDREFMVTNNNKHRPITNFIQYWNPTALQIKIYSE